MLARTVPLAGYNVSNDSSGRKAVSETMFKAIKNELLVFNIYDYINIQEQ